VSSLSGLSVPGTSGLPSPWLTRRRLRGFRLVLVGLVLAGLVLAGLVLAGLVLAGLVLGGLVLGRLSSRSTAGGASGVVVVEASYC
jgi:hypothetical protein